jgi:translation elongation factor EF-G
MNKNMTKGRASMTMEFDHYDVVPANITAEIKATRSG